MTTGNQKLNVNDPSERRRWVREAMVNKGWEQSFWRMFSGKSFKEPVYFINDGKTTDGHNIIFNMRGIAAVKSIKGDDEAFGKGKSKNLFRDKVEVDIHRFPIANNTKYDSVSAGDITLAQHQDAIELLADNFIRWQDQAHFDVLQGCASSTPSHRIAVDKDNMNYNLLVAAESAMKTGNYRDQNATTVGSSWNQRAPIMPFQMKNRKPMWLLVTDAHGTATLKTNRDFQTIAYNADDRGKGANGRGNMLLTGMIGTLGNFIILEAPSFMGKNEVNIGSGTQGVENSEVEHCGVRTFKSAATSAGNLPVPTAWLGDSDYTTTSAAEEWTRGLIVGQGAMYYAQGMAPEYDWETRDFKHISQSALTTWVGFKKAQLKVSLGEDYAYGVTGIDYGMAAVDVRVG